MIFLYPLALPLFWNGWGKSESTYPFVLWRSRHTFVQSIFGGNCWNWVSCGNKDDTLHVGAGLQMLCSAQNLQRRWRNRAWRHHGRLSNVFRKSSSGVRSTVSDSCLFLWYGSECCCGIEYRDMLHYFSEWQG